MKHTSYHIFVEHWTFKFNFIGLKNSKNYAIYCMLLSASKKNTFVLWNSKEQVVIRYQG